MLSQELDVGIEYSELLKKIMQTRVGIAEDGISYQGVSKHLQFQPVIKEEVQAEDFEAAVKKNSARIPKEKANRSICSLSFCS